MRLFKRYTFKRQPAKGYSVHASRKAIFYLAGFSEDQVIREEAVKHILANLSDHTKKLLENRYANRSVTYPQTVRFALETESSSIDPNACKNDQDFLIWVSERSYSRKDNMVAIRQLADQEKLKDIAINDDVPNPEKRMTALSRLVDQDLILEVVLKADDECLDVIEEALRRLPIDKELLLKIINKAESLFIRLKAFEKMDDPKIIRKLAIRNSYHQVRLEAMKRAGNKELLKRIARQDKERDNRLFALQGIDDQKIISKVARYDKDKQVRLAAIYKLQNKGILKRIANKETEDLDIRRRAADKLADDKASNKISARENAIAEEENEKQRDLKNEFIDFVKDYFNHMLIVEFHHSLFDDPVMKGNLSDVIQELDKHGKLHVYDEDPRGSFRIDFSDCDQHRAKLTINVDNYMAANGWVYDDYTFLLIVRTGEDEFVWYQETETREST